MPGRTSWSALDLARRRSLLVAREQLEAAEDRDEPAAVVRAGVGWSACWPATSWPGWTAHRPRRALTNSMSSKRSMPTPLGGICQHQSAPPMPDDLRAAMHTFDGEVETLTACSWCGEPFRPRTGGRPREYCSVPCRRAMGRYREALPRWRAELAQLNASAAAYRDVVPTFLRNEIDGLERLIATSGPRSNLRTIR